MGIIMNKFREPEGSQLDFVKKTFSALEIIKDILQDETGHAPTRTSMNELFLYARGDLGQEKKIKQSLSKYPSMLFALRSMISQIAIYDMPESRAASSEEFPSRYIEDCHIRVELSQAEQNEYYIVITQTGSRQSLLSNMDLFGITNEYERVSLPEARRGITQLLVKPEVGVLELLRDPKTSIFLR